MNILKGIMSVLSSLLEQRTQFFEKGITRLLHGRYFVNICIDEYFVSILFLHLYNISIFRLPSKALDEKREM